MTVHRPEYALGLCAFRHNAFMDRPVLLYDGECNFCIASVRWLEKRRAGDHLVSRAYQSAGSMLSGRGLTPEDCAQAAYLLEADGRFRRGAGAISYALRRLPGAGAIGWKLLGYLYLIPIVKQIEDGVYGLIVKNRHRIRVS
ncbi:MAG: DUF393 domain-containing protein [SAR202 cluster bacterium]|nr:DUF393 domain-containing protein [SAR202 cluster bacterium]